MVDDTIEICHGSPYDEDAYIFDELDVHAQLEEVVFYQAVEEETTSLGKRLVLNQSA